MCMIGSELSAQCTIVFKQCDLRKQTLFFEPIVLEGTGDIRYTKFGREGNAGTWCGINNYGVSFVAVDAYMDKNVSLPDEIQHPTIGIFDEYCRILSDYKDAKSAANYMREILP